MTRHKIIPVDIGGRTSTTDVLYLSGFNVERIVVVMNKVDAGNVGQVAAINYILTYFQPATNSLHDDVPKAYYGWFPPDGGTVAHETVSGAAGVIGGTGPGIVIGSVPGVARYQALWGSLGDTSSATFTSRNYLVGAEQAAIGWTWMGWFFYRGASNTEFYIEANSTITNYLQLFIATNGVLSIAKGGTGMGGNFSSGAGAIPINQWIHLGLVYLHGPQTIQLYVNGVATGGATAYTRASSGTTDRAILNRLGSGQVTLAGVEVYQAELAANDFLRHMAYVNTELTLGTNIVSSASLAANTTFTVEFTNDIAPTYDSASQVIRAPLTAFNAVFVTNGIWRCEVNVWEEE